jgi:hypothetical protein
MPLFLFACRQIKAGNTDAGIGHSVIDVIGIGWWSNPSVVRNRNKIHEAVSMAGAWNQSDCRVLGCSCKPTLHRIRVHKTRLLELKATASEYGEVRDSLDVVS